MFTKRAFLLEQPDNKKTVQLQLQQQIYDLTQRTSEQVHVDTLFTSAHFKRKVSSSLRRGEER